MHARILPLVWKILSDLRYSKLNEMLKILKLLKVYEYDKESYGRKRENGSKVKKKSNLPSLFSFYFSYFSLFNFSLLSIFLHNLVIIIEMNQSSDYLMKEMELVIVCTAFLHQILPIISHSYFAYFAFHYFLVLRTISLTLCALLYTCTVFHSIFSPSYSPLILY